jgi:hypothetical protein
MLANEATSIDKPADIFADGRSMERVTTVHVACGRLLRLCGEIILGHRITHFADGTMMTANPWICL